MLPCRGNFPSGGFKVVYEYANRFVKDGYEVTILYPIRAKICNFSVRLWLHIIKQYVKTLRDGYSCKSWFNLSSKVKEKLVLSLNKYSLPKAQVYIATAVDTAYCLAKCKFNNTKQLYLIQGFENWGVSDEYVYQSYRLGLTNIVISNWLAEKVKQTGARYNLIKNGFDFEYFKLTKTIEERDKYHISMLYHSDERKGCTYGIQTLLNLKKKYPELKATLFGTPKRPLSLPDWIDYFQRPNKDTHNYIYNSSSIYLAPSLQEGWGLTVGESMICGNAVVCTDTLGFREMIVNGFNGLIVPIMDTEGLINKIEYLFNNDSYRIYLAKNGVDSIRQFTWEDSYKKLLDLCYNINE